MAETPAEILHVLTHNAPFDMLPEGQRRALAENAQRAAVPKGSILFEEGAPLEGLYLVESGALDIESSNADLISQRGPGDIMGQRGLLRDGRAMLTARVTEDSQLIMIPAKVFFALLEDSEELSKWFGRSAPTEGERDEGPYATGLTALQVSDLMATTPVTCPESNTVTDVARMMRDKKISSVLVMEDTNLTGIVTVHDMTNKVLAEGLTGDIPVAQVMTPEPMTITPDALGLDALMMMSDHGINHLPVESRGRIVGMIGKTDLFRRQAATASHMIADIVQAEDAEAMAQVMHRVPELLSQLVSAGTRPQAVTRRITDITDAITRRLLVLGEEKLGPAPVPYLWLACGSQGRREQTGQSDQDNCLILHDDMRPEHDTYFAELAQFVSDGLDTCGFIYCPGDMMATNPRWRQPRRVWQEYFKGWIAQPDNEAQMLASVMFDLRPIAGDESLFEDMQAETLRMARKNSIFVAHMISNSLKHTPPLNLFRGFALIRSGEHKNMVDLKHSGVVPVVDLGRIYALQGEFEAVNTLDRIEEARERGVISQSGAHDLLDAYELIAETRLRHQAHQIRNGEAPDNFMAPGALSELERNHLRDAFMVIKTMQSAVGQGKGALG
jgi:CBS domain-containing protein